MNWYRKAQGGETSESSKSPRFSKGQRVRVYQVRSEEGADGEVIDVDYFPVEEKYYYAVKFDDPNILFNETEEYPEEDLKALDTLE